MYYNLHGLAMLQKFYIDVVKLQDKVIFNEEFIQNHDKDSDKE